MATKHGSQTFCLQAVDMLALPFLPASATPCPPLAVMPARGQLTMLVSQPVRKSR